MTGDPDGPPTLPGYSSADNSTGLTAALGLLAQIVSGRGGQVDVSLRDVMLSQLNYRASAYLNDGVEPHRHPFGAHSYYVPAQLFPTADGYLALFITHDGFWKSFAAEAGIIRLSDHGRAGGPARGGARRRHRGAGHRHRDGLGGPAASARDSGRRGAHAARGPRGDAGGRRDGRGFPPGRQPDPRVRLPARVPAAAAPRRARPRPIQLVLDASPTACPARPGR